MKKISNLIYISPNIFPSRAAHTVHIMNMCQSFSNNGLNVTLLIPLKFKNFFLSDEKLKNYYSVNNNFSIIRIPILPTVYGLKLFSYLSLVVAKIINPKICYSRSFIIANLFTKHNINTIFETHGLEFENFLKYNILKRLSLKKVVVISKALLNLYIKNNINTSKFEVRHDGANIDLKKNNTKINFNDNKTHVGYVGHLYQGRGIKLIMELALNRKKLIFHIVGGTEKDIAYWTNVSLEMGLTNVIFEGYLNHGKATTLRKSFDVLLAPYENKVAISGGTGDTSQWMSPLKIFEYMSDTKPILVSDLPVLHEVLKHKFSCLFCKVNDLEGWLENLDTLTNDKEFAKKIAVNSFNDLKNSYTWDIRALNITKDIKFNK